MTIRLRFLILVSVFTGVAFIGLCESWDRRCLCGQGTRGTSIGEINALRNQLLQREREDRKKREEKERRKAKQQKADREFATSINPLVENTPLGLELKKRESELVALKEQIKSLRTVRLETKSGKHSVEGKIAWFIEEGEKKPLPDNFSESVEVVIFREGNLRKNTKPVPIGALSDSSTDHLRKYMESHSRHEELLLTIKELKTAVEKVRTTIATDEKWKFHDEFLEIAAKNHTTVEEAIAYPDLHYVRDDNDKNNYKNAMSFFCYLSTRPSKRFLNGSFFVLALRGNDGGIMYENDSGFDHGPTAVIDVSFAKELFKLSGKAVAATVFVENQRVQIDNRWHYCLKVCRIEAGETVLDRREWARSKE